HAHARTTARTCPCPWPRRAGTINPVLGPRGGSLVVLALPPTFPCPIDMRFRVRPRPAGADACPVPFVEAQMGKKLYVGNLTYDTTDSTLEQLFAPFGTVQSDQVIMDRDTGRSKGFGFVEMGSDQAAQAANKGLSEKE